MSSVVKPEHFKVKTTLDIVPQKTNFVDVIDTGTTTHCFLKERNVETNHKCRRGNRRHVSKLGRHTIPQSK